MFFYFFKISKFALPGVMLIYERTSIDRKKKKKKKKKKRRTLFVGIDRNLLKTAWMSDFAGCSAILVTFIKVT